MDRDQRRYSKETDSSDRWVSADHQTFFFYMNPTLAHFILSAFSSTPAFDSTTHLHTGAKLEWPVNIPTHTSLRCGRKAERPVKAERSRGERATSTQTLLEVRTEPRSLEKWGSNSIRHATFLPTHPSPFSAGDPRSPSRIYFTSNSSSNYIYTEQKGKYFLSTSDTHPFNQ